jgi:opacity protein-like surface antigen
MKKFAVVLVAVCFAVFLAASAVSAQEEPPPVGQEQQGFTVYFYRDGELTGVEREVPGGGQMVEFTILELLKGPTEEEKAEGFYTEIPEGVKLQYTTRSNDGRRYGVNLSREFLALEEDPAKAARALAQLEKTVREASGAETIDITIAPEELGGQPLDAYEALGVPHGGEEGQAEAGGVSGLVIGLAVGIPLFLLLVFFIAWRTRKGRGKRGKGAVKRRSSRRKKGKK